MLISFGLPSNYRVILHEEIFNLCYYSQGGFTQSEVYQLPVHLRQFYLRKLTATKEKEASASEAANRQTTSGPNIAKPPRVS